MGIYNDLYLKNGWSRRKEWGFSYGKWRQAWGFQHHMDLTILNHWDFGAWSIAATSPAEFTVRNFEREVWPETFEDSESIGLAILEQPPRVLEIQFVTPMRNSEKPGRWFMGGNRLALLAGLCPGVLGVPAGNDTLLFGAGVISQERWWVVNKFKIPKPCPTPLGARRSHHTGPNLFRTSLSNRLRWYLFWLYIMFSYPHHFNINVCVYI